MAREKVVKVKPFKLEINVDQNGYIDPKGATVTIKCPYCKRNHTHGFATGYRNPHCGPGYEDKNDYWLDCDKFEGKVVVRNPLKNRNNRTISQKAQETAL